MASLKLKKYGHPRFYEIIEQMKQLHSDKNHDYAGDENPLSNLTACKRIKIRCPECNHKFRLPAWVGVVIRLQDKLSRLENLVGSDPKVKGESIADTFSDGGVYNILGRVLFEEEQ